MGSPLVDQRVIHHGLTCVIAINKKIEAGRTQTNNKQPEVLVTVRFVSAQKHPLGDTVVTHASAIFLHTWEALEQFHLRTTDQTVEPLQQHCKASQVTLALRRVRSHAICQPEYSLSQPFIKEFRDQLMNARLLKKSLSLPTLCNGKLC